MWRIAYRRLRQKRGQRKAASGRQRPLAEGCYRPITAGRERQLSAEAVTPQHRDLSNPVAFIINKQLAIFFGKSPELLLRQQIKYLLRGATQPRS